MATAAPIIVAEVPNATVTDGTGTSSVCAETFIMSCYWITEVQVMCSTSKAGTQRRPAEALTERSSEEIVGSSDSRTKQIAALHESRPSVKATGTQDSAK